MNDKSTIKLLILLLSFEVKNKLFKVISINLPKYFYNITIIILLIKNKSIE